MRGFNLSPVEQFAWVLTSYVFFDILVDLRRDYCCRRAPIAKCEHCRDWRCPRWHTEFIEQLKQEALDREKNS